MVAGVIWGSVNGALPGFGAATGIALILPFTFGLEPVVALPMLAAVYAGGIYGGSITSIMLGIPGTSSAAATIFDGYEMTKKGQSKKALTGALVASAIGGILGGLVLLFAAPPLARAALLFGPAEYFVLAIFGLTIIASLASGHILKGFISGLIGLFIGTIGMDPIRGAMRYSFGFMHLYDGIPLIPLILSLFAFPRCLSLVKRISNNDINQISNKENKVEGTAITVKEVKDHWKTILKSSVIGSIIGIIPAAGANIACFVGYSEAKRSSKDPSKYGTGILDGVIAAEAANNSVTGGSLVPMLTLGIPGNAVAAVLLGALMIQGLAPGFQLFTQHADITYTFILSIIVAHVIKLITMWKISPIFAKIARVPVSILAPTLLIISLIGAFVQRNYHFDVVTTSLLGLGFYFLMQIDFSMPAVLLGAILGPIAETGFRRAMLTYSWDLTIFFKRPLSLFLIFLTIISIYAGLKMDAGDKKLAELNEEQNSDFDK